jgi:RNA polymerase sigma factor for flagellar operon FliA
MSDSAASLLEPTPEATAASATREAESSQRYRLLALDADGERDLIERYLPLMVRTIQRLCPILPESTTMDEWINLASMALIQAARTYDPTKQVSFEHFCRICIRNTVFSELRRIAPVSRRVYRLRRELEDVIWELSQTLGREPEENEVAQRMGLSLKEYWDRLDDIRHISFESIEELHNPTGSESPYGGIELVDPTEQSPLELVENRDLCALVRDRLLKLPQAQRTVLSLFYYEGLRMKDIGELLDLTEARICQIHAQAVTSLRSHLRRHT